MSEQHSDWESGKEAHRELSAAAAGRYDELYESMNFATGSYMRFEVDTLRAYMQEAPTRSLALDLGCGTGRDSFLLSEQFKQVYGYDFSPEMIEVANRNKLKHRAGNVLFEQLDVELEPLPLGDETVPFVNSGFGMGSFLRHPEQAFREVRRVLQHHGLAVFSFYNADALVNGLDMDWRPALAARAVPNSELLQVEFESSVYRISAKMYTIQEVTNKLSGNFRLQQLFTYPTLTALLPQTMFKSKRARELCTRVDQLLADNTEIAAGPYIVAVCRKGGPRPRQKESLGYARVLQLLAFHQIPPEIREHRPVRSMDDVRDVLDAQPGEMVKSVLIAADVKSDKKDKDGGRLDAELYLVAVPADRKVAMGTLARVLSKKRQQLRFANQMEVEELTGFQVGSIPPFGLPRKIPVILDSRLAGLRKVWCGTGKATESLHLTIEELKRLSACMTADISRAGDTR